MTKSGTAELASRIETADIYDSRLDKEVARALGWIEEPDGWHLAGIFFADAKLRRTSYSVNLPAFTNSVDAVLENMLGPPGFPLWTVTVKGRSHGRHGMSWSAEVTVPSREAQGMSTRCAAAAACAAAIRAWSFANG